MISRKELGRIYNLHQKTVGKWIKEAVKKKELVLTSSGKLLNDVDCKNICDKFGWDYEKIK